MAVPPPPPPKGGPSSSSAPPPLARPTRPLGPAGKLSGVCVIAVPPAITAIVNMYNAQDLLEKGVYESGPDKKAAGAVKEASISVRHTFEDGTYANFLVLDNPLARLQQTDWPQLTVVVVQGSTWQFKGWPYPKGEPELFNKTHGVSFRFSDEIPNQKTKGWKVKNYVFSKEKTRSHEVTAVMSEFWIQVHKFITVNKPHLLHKASGKAAH